MAHFFAILDRFFVESPHLFRESAHLFFAAHLPPVIGLRCMPPKGLFSVSPAVGFFAGVLTLVLPALAFPGLLLVLGLIRACCLLSLCLSFSTALAFVFPTL